MTFFEYTLHRYRTTSWTEPNNYNNIQRLKLYEKGEEIERDLEEIPRSMAVMKSHSTPDSASSSAAAQRERESDS